MTKVTSKDFKDLSPAQQEAVEHEARLIEAYTQAQEVEAMTSEEAFRYHFNALLQMFGSTKPYSTEQRVQLGLANLVPFGLGSAINFQRRQYDEAELQLQVAKDAREAKRESSGESWTERTAKQNMDNAEEAMIMLSNFRKIAIEEHDEVSYRKFATSGQEQAQDKPEPKSPAQEKKEAKAAAERRKRIAAMAV